tara:strand:- start:3515 stop:4546 length:1032 start_codon:yes stop_codon:yes gene_type:complete
MKFGIWRHENSIGNSAEHTIGLAMYLKSNNIDPSSIEVYVENEWQKDFVLCIDGICEKNVKFFEGIVDSSPSGDKSNVQDIYMPNVYPAFPLSYECNWDYLEKQKHLDVTLKFDSESYENKFNLPKDAIVLFHREEGTWWKRVDGSNSEPQRFVDPKIFHKLALHYANLGHKVIKIGDKNQAPLPGKYSNSEFGADYEHPNIVDFTKYLNNKGEPLWTLRDYLFILQNCKAFVSCDAGIWPLAAAMKKNMVFCNVACIFELSGMGVEEAHIDHMISAPFKGETVSLIPLTMKRFKGQMVDWMPKETTKVIYKKFFVDRHDKNGYIKVSDNSFDEIKEALESFL